MAVAGGAKRTAGRIADWQREDAEQSPWQRAGLTPLRPLARPQQDSILASMRTSVSTKGQIVLPADIRRQDGIEPGEEFEIERIGRGEYRLVRVSSPRNQGFLDWLLACPEKGFFVPIEPESTETL